MVSRIPDVISSKGSSSLIFILIDTPSIHSVGKGDIARPLLATMYKTNKKLKEKAAELEAYRAILDGSKLPLTAVQYQLEGRGLYHSLIHPVDEEGFMPTEHKGKGPEDLWKLWLKPLEDEVNSKGGKGKGGTKAEGKKEDPQMERSTRFQALFEEKEEKEQEVGKEEEKGNGGKAKTEVDVGVTKMDNGMGLAEGKEAAGKMAKFRTGEEIMESVHDLWTLEHEERMIVYRWLDESVRDGAEERMAALAWEYGTLHLEAKAIKVSLPG